MWQVQQELIGYNQIMPQIQCLVDQLIYYFENNTFANTITTINNN